MNFLTAISRKRKSPRDMAFPVQRLFEQRTEREREREREREKALAETRIIRLSLRSDATHVSDTLFRVRVVNLFAWRLLGDKRNSVVVGTYFAALIILGYLNYYALVSMSVVLSSRARPTTYLSKYR